MKSIKTLIWWEQSKNSEKLCLKDVLDACFALQGKFDVTIF